MAKKPIEKVEKTSEEVVEKEVVKEPVKQTPKKKQQIDRDSLIRCFNVTNGKLSYTSKKTGLQTVWSKYGDEEYIEFAELLTMKASQPKFIDRPWIFIEDEEVVNQLGLKEMYKNIIPVHEVDDFFALHVDKAKEIIPKLPKGMKELIGDKARQGIQNGDLNNLKLIRLLEQELQLDLISLMD